MSVQQATAPHSPPPALALPDFHRLTLRQQIAIDCAGCGRHLGMSGSKLGQVQWRGCLFTLWACGPVCATSQHQALSRVS